jgi:hypothetical protein
MTATAEKTAPAEAKPIKLDIGAGKNRHAADFQTIDILPFEGVDHVMDVRQTPWPWEDDSVAAVFTSHFVEHLSGEERIPFFNELYRVMAWGAQCTIVVPAWSHDRAYGDPSHKWPPMSGWSVMYLLKGWRDVNAPHVGYTCDFDWQSAGNWDPWLGVRHDEVKVFAMARYVNSLSDYIFTLTKTKRS